MSTQRLVAAIDERCRRMGYPSFAWWIILAVDGFALGAGLVAVLQRAGQDAVLPAALLIAVAVTPWLLGFAGVRLPWWAFMAVTLSATGVLMVLFPVDYDFAFLVWVLLVGHVGATEPLQRSLVAIPLAMAALGLLALVEPVDGAILWLAALVVGGDIGVVMRHQQLRIDEEERLHREHEAAAVLQERQRIAREVHDVVAHSLSVTMLHLTAARRSLEQDREAGIDEAVDALRDAEGLGREAMTDIRKTVGLLGQDSTPSAAPDLRDLPALVNDFQQAGLGVSLEVRGDPALVAPNDGLGLYRIVQESLANVAKHEPGSQAEVLLDCAADEQRVRISNTRVLRRPRQGGGSGLKGMRQRADLMGGSFQAGPDGDRWVVEVSVPGRTSTGGEWTCPLSARSAAPPSHSADPA